MATRARVGTPGAGAQALADPPFLLHLAGQVGDPDLAGAAGLDARLDRRADVVGVDVAVPQPVAADDHDRLADLHPRGLEGVDLLVGGVEQVHHLVPGTLHASAVATAFAVSDHHRRLRFTLRRLRHRSAVDHLEEGVEEEDEAGAAGVDHPRLLQHREQLRRAGEGVAGRADSGVEHLDQGLLARRHRHCRLRCLPHDGEDRPLDRPHDRGVGGGAGLGQGRRHRGPVGPLGVVEAVAEPPQDLGQDHARVAPRPHERAVGDGLAGGDHVAGFRHSVEGRHHRLQGEGHVGAGVAVGDGIDVEPVQSLLVGP